MVAKRKATGPLTPPVSLVGSRSDLDMISRRSSRSLSRKNYAQHDLLDDPDVFGDPLDKEASPDQSSELSVPPSLADHTEEHSDDSDESLSDHSTISKMSIESTKASKGAAKPRKKASAAKKPSKAQSSNVAANTPVATDEDAGETFAGETLEEGDADDMDEVKQTKASKFRERDARAAEKYAEFEARPPTVDSDYVPLPFKGRLGYACLNTILRSRKEPVFCSRTTRIATIAKEDKGMPFVLELGRQNAADLSRMLEWNEKYGIRFLRLSSEMFPFASHPDYLYNLEHADAELRAAGALANKYDHRLTCHPGQFTQIASPNPKIFDNAVRDLEFHNELLERLHLEPEQRDRDAVMILHLGGAYGDKPATLDRFRKNYARLSPAVQRRLVLENDDMSWSVSDLLPLCQELNIPMVLDWHHHNIVRDEEKFREGTLDILPILPAIAETWSRKGITQKMHISEARLPNHPLPSKRRSHSARVYHLPPCADTMDIMIEAKDKEQAVFELSKAYGLNNPPLPPEVVGDGPGAKGDEAYWPEGQELRLKTTKTRVKKEMEVDSDGQEIKPKPKPKKRVKKEPETTSEEAGAVSSPDKQTIKEEVLEASNDLQEVPDSRPRRKSARKSQIKSEIEEAVDEVMKKEETSEEQSLSKPAKRRSSVKKEPEHETIDPPLAKKTRQKRTTNRKQAAATRVERETGIGPADLVEGAIQNLEAKAA